MRADRTAAERARIASVLGLVDPAWLHLNSAVLDTAYFFEEGDLHRRVDDPVELRDVLADMTTRAGSLEVAAVHELTDLTGAVTLRAATALALPDVLLPLRLITLDGLHRLQVIEQGDGSAPDGWFELVGRGDLAPPGGSPVESIGEP